MFCRNMYLRLRPNFYILLQHRLCSGSKDWGSDFASKFSIEEEAKILNTLNNSSNEQLLSLNVPKTKVKHLLSCREQNGHFTTLEDTFNASCLSVNIFEKICRGIIEEKANNLKKKSTTVNINPKLDSKRISTSVGIHLSNSGVSWAQVHELKNNLITWGMEDLEHLPHKMPLDVTYNLAVRILHQIPISDAYVFEEIMDISYTKQARNPTVIALYAHQVQLMSMLMVLLNTSSKHNPEFEKEHKNKVHFVKSKLPARMFKTLLGGEVVSSMNIISHLMEISDPELFTLPCEPISIGEELKNTYQSLSLAHRELLGQALMLTLTFSNVFLKVNSNSISSIKGIKWKNEKET